MPNLFAHAASLLLGERPEPAAADAQSGAKALLRELDYAIDGGDPGDDTRHRARLLQAASQFLRVFELAAPDAPGLVCFGAQFDPAIADPMHAGGPAVGVSGVGLSPQEAFQSCIGEGVEYLSQLQTAEDVLAPPHPPIRRPPLVRRPNSSSRRFRPTSCAPRPSFHGAARGGSTTAARSCCRRICACAGRRRSNRSSRHFR